MHWLVSECGVGLLHMKGFDGSLGIQIIDRAGVG